MLFKWFSRLYHTIIFIILLGIFVHIFAPILVEASPIPNVFINEIHYDNTGSDQNEFIELAGMAGINLDGWSLHFYNGSNGNEYKEYTFTDWLISDSVNGYGFAAVNIAGIQNGSPDGIVLTDAVDNIIQFISYEGVFTANSGIATGLTSIDIGVSQSSATALGLSLQLTGVGQQYSDFSWGTVQLNTFGTENIQQSFIDNNAAVIPVSEPSSLPLILLALLSLNFVAPKRFVVRKRY